MDSAAESGDEVLAEGGQKHAPHFAPLIEVDTGVFDTSPFASDGRHLAGAIQLAEMFFTVDHEVLELLRGHFPKKGGLIGDALFEGFRILSHVCADLFPVRLPDKLCDDAGDFFHVFRLGFPVDIIFVAEEFRIRIFSQDITPFLSESF